jgi:hypothetical protein
MALAAALMCLLASAANVAAQETDGWSTGFEATTSATNPVAYGSGSLLFQDGWDLGGADRTPRVMTSDEITQTLTTAGLNVGPTTHSGDQALMVIKPTTATETTGYFVRDIFPEPNTLDAATKVRVDFWARPLTGAPGADPSGSPSGTNTDVGEREGNVFFGLADTNDGGSGQRIAAVRFGVDTDPPMGVPPMYGNIVQRHIDYASDVSGVWNKSGLLWEADTWYNFRMDIDFTSKTYNFFVNGTKVNAAPINFYHAAATAAHRFFVSKGTNQAGAILDDISVTPIIPGAGDFNHDGTVDGADFILWQRDNTTGSLSDFLTNYGSSASAAASAVPEPTAFALAAGLLLIGAGAGRRKQVAA